MHRLSDAGGVGKLPAMMAPWTRVCTPARMLKMVWLKMYDPVSPAPVSAVTVLQSPALQLASL